MYAFYFLFVEISKHKKTECTVSKMFHGSGGKKDTPVTIQCF